MRGIVRLILIVCIFAAVWGNYSSDLDRVWNKVLGKKNVHDRMENARISLAYSLVEHQWINFSIPLSVDGLRIISNAEIPNNDTGSEGTWEYSIEYRLLDENGIVLREGVYNHITKQVLYKDSPEDPPYPGVFYFKDSVTPAGTRKFLLNFRGLQSHPELVQLRLGHLGTDVSGVVCRVYNREPTSEDRLAYQWGRLTPYNQEQLAEGNVYPSEFLTRYERTNLLRYSWKAIGPMGVEGREYSLKKLYVLREIEGKTVEEYIPPGGPALAPGRLISFVVPEAGGQYRLEVKTTQESKAQGEVTLLLHKADGNEIQKNVFPWKEPHTTLDVPLSAGVAELHSDTSIVVSISRIDGDDIVAVDDAVSIRVYQTNSEERVVYPVAHNGAEPTPFRIDIRMPLTSHVHTASVKVQYSLLGEDGTEVGTYQVDTEPLPHSPHDALLRVNEDSQYISQRYSVYLKLPPEVKSVAIWSREIAYVNAYNRPPDMVRVVTVPEEYYRELPREQRLSTWFPLRPNKVWSFIYSGHSAIVKLHPKAAEVDPEIQAGRYHWEAFRPSGRWAGRYILLEGNEPEHLRKQALDVRFKAISRNKTSRLRLGSTIGSGDVRPRLVFVKRGVAPVAVSVLVDGTPVYSGIAAGSRGVLDLPEMPSGINNVTVQSDTGQWYVSNVITKGAVRTLRFVPRLDKDGLQFQYNKQDHLRENITLELFVPEKYSKRVHLDVWLEAVPDQPLQPQQELTVKHRLYDIRPGEGGPLPVFNTRTLSVGGGQKFFFPVGSDIPPGQYTLRVRLSSGPECYLLASRITPRMKDRRAVFTEE